ncbi:RsmD family RNA methyltransferase, partial [Clostridioides difficile]
IIAELAKDFVGPGMCIYLDSSTTVYELCPFLSTIDNLIIFTNGLNTAQLLSELSNPTMKIFVTGGEVKHHSASVVNHSMENSLLEHFSLMRIVSGSYGGRPLKTLDGKTTRPTSDKVRGAMFNMIGPYFEGGRVLDLYAGSGGLSIEAISRGMESAVLVERDRRAQAIIRENIAMTKEADK